MDDSHFGILLYWTRTSGIGGIIKQKLEDFVVEEIPLEFPEGETHVAFLVEKRGVSTFDAIQRIARWLRVDRRVVGYAGLKDRYAVTRQWMSVPSVDEKEVRRIDVPGLAVLETRRVGGSIHLGDLAGNRFTVVIRGVKLGMKVVEEMLHDIKNEIKQRGVPNFFGPQRFGQNRPVTHLVGRKIVKGDFDGAVHAYLSLDFEGEMNDTREVRRRLAEEKNFRDALEYFPRSLAYERALLRVLAEGGGAIRALRSLPLGLTKLFIDAYQSYIFNLSLSRFLQQKETIENFPAPVVGYKTLLTDNEFDTIVKRVLDEEGVSEQSFFIDRLPELSQKGTLRSAMIYPEITFTVASGSARLTFELKKGSYATVVLREIMKS